jgi:hypothetical protein
MNVNKFITYISIRPALRFHDLIEQEDEEPQQSMRIMQRTPKGNTESGAGSSSASTGSSAGSANSSAQHARSGDQSSAQHQGRNSGAGGENSDGTAEHGRRYMTLEEREAAYQAARARIFNDSKQTSTTSSSSDTSQSAQANTTGGDTKSNNNTSSTTKRNSSNVDANRTVNTPTGEHTNTAATESAKPTQSTTAEETKANHTPASSTAASRATSSRASTSANDSSEKPTSTTASASENTRKNTRKNHTQTQTGSSTSEPIQTLSWNPDQSQYPGMPAAMLDAQTRRAMLGADVLALRPTSTMRMPGKQTNNISVHNMAGSHAAYTRAVNWPTTPNKLPQRPVPDPMSNNPPAEVTMFAARAPDLTAPCGSSIPGMATSARATPAVHGEVLLTDMTGQPSSSSATPAANIAMTTHLPHPTYAAHAPMVMQHRMLGSTLHGAPPISMTPMHGLPSQPSIAPASYGRHHSQQGAYLANMSTLHGNPFAMMPQSRLPQDRVFHGNQQMYPGGYMFPMLMDPSTSGTTPFEFSSGLPMYVLPKAQSAVPPTHTATTRRPPPRSTELFDPNRPNQKNRRQTRTRRDAAPQSQAASAQRGSRPESDDSETGSRTSTASNATGRSRSGEPRRRNDGLLFDYSSHQAYEGIKPTDRKFILYCPVYLLIVLCTMLF